MKHKRSLNIQQFRKLYGRVKGECSFCGGKLRGRQRTFCSTACSHEYRLLAWPGYARKYILKRDGGICQLCGEDCIGLRKTLTQLGKVLTRGQREVLCQILSLPYWTHHLWEADHTLALCEGGGNEFSNLRTLCYWCHKEVTRELNVRRSEHRRSQCQEKTNKEPTDKENP